MRAANHTENDTLHAQESANHTISISTQTMEKQIIMYTYKHGEIKHL